MNTSQTKTFKEFLLEMPVEYPGEIKYMADEKFPVISLSNIDSYEELGFDDKFIYKLNEDTGFVFKQEDYENATGSIGCKPVLRLSLRDGILGMKQAHHLRGRKVSARQDVAKTWYYLYAKAKGGVVSDFEHLQGGKALWMSLIKTGHVTSCWKDSTKETPVTEADIPNLWSTYPNQEKKDLVLIYRPR